ncbi:MAG: hypothetical protein GX981_06700 [Tissierellia bacterium]|nr:hypothetical protein [Tissierellia bacterium]
MKSVWQHLLESIIFFVILGLIYNILNRFNIIVDPNTQDTLIIGIAVALIIVWTFVNMRINRKARETEEEK